MTHPARYKLIKRLTDKKIFKLPQDEPLPKWFEFVKKVYDENGLLLPKYWNVEVYEVE